MSLTSPVAPVADSALDQIRNEVSASVAKTSKELAAPGAKVTTRNMSNAAYAILVLGGPPDQAENLLRAVFNNQNMDPQSPEYGTMPWILNSTEVKDANSIDFGTQSWGPIFLDHAGQLSSGFKQEAQAHIQAALVALEHHHVAVSYTNIFLMNTVNTLLLSGVVNDTAQHQRALNQLAAWIAYTQQNGIHEFDSPTYYGVDLNCLVTAFCHEKDPALHAKFGAILDYFWEDIASNHNPALERSLVGAHSRDYFFLRGTGALDDYLHLEGMLGPRKPGALDDGQIFELDNELNSHGYHPSDLIKGMAGAGERVILQKFDIDPVRVRATYITPGFSVGTAPGDYSPQDKMFAVDFATAKDIPSITVVPDTFDAPYGLIKVKDKSGHDKATHEPLHPACVQDKGNVVMLLDLDPSHVKNATSFATNLILPAQADEILVDGKRIDFSQPFELPVASDSVISVHENQACLTARFFQVDPLNGTPPQFELRAEKTGLKEGAARWVIYHARQIDPLMKMPGHLRVGLVVEVLPWQGEEAFQAMGRTMKTLQIDQQSNAGMWQVSTTIAGRKLEVAEDLAKRAQVYAKIAGQPCAAPTPLSVNGKDIPLVP